VSAAASVCVFKGNAGVLPQVGFSGDVLLLLLLL
jgi:hypothetical protein